MSLMGMVAALTAAGVRFVVIGGLAARAHGSARITEDLGICYDPDPGNLQRLADCLAGWHAYLRGVEPGLPWAMDVRALRTNPVLTLRTDQGDIDVMDRVAGVGDFAAVLAGSVEVLSEGSRFRALDLPSLLKAKRAAKRPKDLDQIPELEALLVLQQRRRGSG
ncbi:MAG: hypothetical protein HY560_05190 [Gemmatimonadetes bacterium]|nr:hypothetical protein [Gemmatimonadota bacterium]